MSSLVYKAQVFAMAAHGAIGQKRKYTGEPYIVHPAEVVQILKTAGVTDPNMLAAAWLHDVVEDTRLHQVALVQVFGPVVAILVSNTRSIVTYDPNFARVYLKEKALLLEVLRDCSHPVLWAQANELLEKSLCEL